MSEKGSNTNMASEFHVMSSLTRLGYNVNLTLGNKKKVDIVIPLDNGTYFTVDVKAVAGKFDWPTGGKEPPEVRQSFLHFRML